MRKKNNSQSTSLFNDENNLDLPTPDHDKIQIWLDDNLETICRSLISVKLADHVPELKYKRIIEKRWEFNVTRPASYQSYDKIVVGNIDIYTRVLHDVWSDEYIDAFNTTIPARVVEGSSILLFEIKPIIRSLGALIRQINLYKEYLKGSYYIVSPDATYKHILKEQNIGFIQYPQNDIK